ncbi:MAG: hypothetical protein QW566_11425 [Candidatus Jordarchaeales archaeon]
MFERLVSALKIKRLVNGKKALLAVAPSLALILSLLIGLNIGRMQGSSEAYSAAYQHARNEVYNEAWGAGYVEGFREGNRTGFDQGHQLGKGEGYEEGYRRGVEDGAGRGVTLRDPTYGEVEDFVKLDKTDELRYSPEGYTFLDLAAKFKANAMTSGFRCGLTIFLIDNGVAALNCFNTTDKGMVYIEPWSDRIFTVRPGEFYGSGKVLKITIIW